MSLLNKTAVRDLALRLSLEMRGGKFKRVGTSFLDRIEARTREVIAAEIHRHPSLGETLK
ncbi:MAG: hypothetical protein AB1705_15385 [Verrucomicrobiota bacterium]